MNGTKIPKQLNGANARTNDPSTFESYDAVSELEYKAFVIQESDALTGVDLDDCLETVDGELILRDWAKPIVRRLNPVAYGEISPSGTGIKFLTRGSKLAGARCVARMGDGKQALEVYDKARFWTVTEDYWLGSQMEIGDGQDAIDWLCKEYLSQPKQSKPAEPLPPINYTVGHRSSVYSRGVDYINQAERPISHRNNAAFRLSGALRAIDDHGQRLSNDEVVELVKMWNQSLPDPLDERELLRTIESSAVNGTARETKHVKEFSTGSDHGVDFSRLVAGSPVEPGVQPVEPIAPIEPVPQIPSPENELSIKVFGIDEETEPDARGMSESSQPTWAMQDQGIIGHIVDYTLRTSMYPQPELAFAGALALMSVITGRKVTDMYGTRTNLYIIGMAPSGSGKEQARSTNKKLLRRADAAHLLGPERFASHAGIVSVLGEQPSQLFQLDEVGRLLQTMKNPSRATHLYNIASVLMHLYSSSGQTWVGDAYADTSKTKTIHQPHAVIYGTTVAESFWGSLTAENVSDGLLGRLMPFESTEGYVEPKSPERIEPLGTLVDAIKWWVDQRPPLNEESCEPSIVAVHTQEARKRFEDHMREIHNKHRDEDEQARALWSRAPGRAGKLALLFAISRQPETNCISIEVEDVDRAIAISNWLTRRVQKKVFDHVVENETEERTKRVLRMLDEPVTRTQLSRRTQWLKKREREEVLDTLFESGQVVFWEVLYGGKRPVTAYVKRSKFSDELLQRWLDKQAKARSKQS
ncbi:DUF3987 domain-containing protein [Stieleria sp. JC731]|uniref:DUF3987 domain-containing protein n=1 Tax=Pirellulaceae TaxID=2691357 RepID=UPI001E3C0454|nr:DUF3987 domain-containing protein [Stieleria sp. JC731]MCC9603530.1 DUF3987 domain-containing protein [Stieleria sp. JC731]